MGTNNPPSPYVTYRIIIPARVHPFYLHIQSQQKMILSARTLPAAEDTHARALFTEPSIQRMHARMLTCLKAHMTSLTARKPRAGGFLTEGMPTLKPSRASTLAWLN